MIDIKLIRTNPDLVKANIKKREMNLDSVVDEILEIDAKRRELTGSTEAMKAEQNACTKKIPAMKKAGEDVAPVMAEMKALSEKIKAADAELGEIEEHEAAVVLDHLLEVEGHQTGSAAPICGGASSSSGASSLSPVSSSALPPAFAFSMAAMTSAFLRMAEASTP